MSHINSSDLKLVAKSISYKKGEKILNSFEETKNIYEITEGLVKLYTVGSKGKENIGVFYGPGDLFPLSWLINEKRPAVSFQALTDCKIIVVPLNDFHSQLRDNADLSVKFVKQIVKQFALYATTVNNLGLKFAKERLAYRLLVMADRFGTKRNGGVLIPYVTNHDLGALVNMTRESINIEMNKMVRQGVIEFDRLNITIKDIEKLKLILGKKVSIIFFDNI